MHDLYASKFKVQRILLYFHYKIGFFNLLNTYNGKAKDVDYYVEQKENLVHIIRKIFPRTCNMDRTDNTLANTMMKRNSELNIF